MTDLYERSDMTVKEASNNINRNIVKEEYCDCLELDDGVIFGGTKMAEWVKSDTVETLEDRL